MSAPLETLARMVAGARRIVAFTGAGVSTESGIPDFRSPGGIWTRFDPRDFEFPRFVASAEVRRRYWQASLEVYPALKAAEPNPAHRVLAELYRRGRLRRVITQNIDNLHQRAGLPGDAVLEIHGNAMWVGCLDCGARSPRDEIQARVAAGDLEPRCTECRGILKPTTISFGQAMPERETTEAFAEARACELLLCIGTSLVVYPAAAIPYEAKQAGARVVLVNLSSTEFDEEADLLVRERAGVALQGMLEVLDGRPVVA